MTTFDFSSQFLVKQLLFLSIKITFLLNHYPAPCLLCCALTLGQAETRDSLWAEEQPGVAPHPVRAHRLHREHGVSLLLFVIIIRASVLLHREKPNIVF